MSLETKPHNTEKKRHEFVICDFSNKEIGYGTVYSYGGNCQVYLEQDKYAARQLAMLGEVMLFEDVKSMEW